MRAPFVLTAGVATLMAVQATLGLLFHEQYRDTGWIKAAWFGNDWVTLLVAVPLLGTALLLASRGSRRALLLWFGVLGYAVYNYAYYLFGAALNAFFPLYVAALVLSVLSLFFLVSRVEPASACRLVSPTTSVRIAAGYLIFVGFALMAVWLAFWAGYVFAGTPTPIEPEAFKLVAALDLSIMTTVLISGGVLLLRRHAWGSVVAAIGAVQGSLYLVVLSVNAVVVINRGLAVAPGEVPVWGTLATLTVVATVLLLRDVGDFRTPKRA
jgi:hypothetical protein